MNKVKALLAGLDEEKGSDWNTFSEAQHPDRVMLETDKIRRWLGMPTSGAPRPSAEFIRVLLAFGREGLVRIWNAYVEEAPWTTSEFTVTLGALAMLVREARAKRLVGWSIDDLQPPGAAKNSKLLIAVDDGLNARLREAAAARGETITAFARESLRDRLARLEKTPRRTAGNGATAAEAR